MMNAIVPPISLFSLKFVEPSLELRFQHRHDARARAQDQQAAAIYLGMVAFGSLLYLLIATFLPASRVASIDNCSSLIICSWIGPAAHLAVLLLLPDAVYVRHRTAIILGLRLFYLLATSVNGFGMCGVGPVNAAAMNRVTLKPTAAAAAAAASSATAGPAAASVAAATVAAARQQLESPFSAFLWRSGVIGLVWYAGAFPLLFWQHCLVQTGFLVAYWFILSPLVCDTLPSVNQGSQAVAAVLCVGHSIWATLLAAVGAHGLATEHAQKAAAAAAAAAGSGFAGGYGSCMQGVCFLQLILGHALPSLVLYCAESRTRVHWWLAAQRGSSSSSSGGGSEGSSGGGGGSGSGSASGEPAALLLHTSSSDASLCNRLECFYAAQEAFGAPDSDDKQQLMAAAAAGAGGGCGEPAAAAAAAKQLVSAGPAGAAGDLKQQKGLRMGLRLGPVLGGLSQGQQLLSKCVDAAALLLHGGGGSQEDLKAFMDGSDKQQQQQQQQQQQKQQKQQRQCNAGRPLETGDLASLRLASSSSSSSSSSSRSSRSSSSSSSSIDKPWLKPAAAAAAAVDPGAAGKQLRKLGLGSGSSLSDGGDGTSGGGSTAAAAAALTWFDIELLRAGLPPGGAELYVLVLLLGLAWLLLQQLF